jgi:hypothetical protein
MNFEFLDQDESFEGLEMNFSLEIVSSQIQ